ncbi:MAG: class I SAM-dependent methyltransferase [Cyclobacteriaceae bacterium]|nr:class I SAM-dependent methyltransferase [Cyclobacteriaceae bacterium]
MKEFWNERYGQKEFAYGTKPNTFFKEQLGKLNVRGSILLPAEGEGRNAVFAAKQGLQVTAFDTSEEARNKALQLAETNKVNITYFTGALEQIKLKDTSFDAIGLIFAHFPPQLKTHYHKQFIDFLKPGGLIILEGFSKKQLNYSSGGPKNLDMLFSLKEIESDFDGLETLVLDEKLIELDEGLFHQGDASVVRFVGKKPEN